MSTPWDLLTFVVISVLAAVGVCLATPREDRSDAIFWFVTASACTWGVLLCSWWLGWGWIG